MIVILEGDCMKSIIFVALSFFCIMQLVCMNEEIQDHEKQAKSIEIECCAIIDDIFKQARISLEEHQDIIELEWLKRGKINELQNCVSDGMILSFDNNHHNVIPGRLDLYVSNKIREEAQMLFECDKITAEGMRQFFYLSKIVCGLSQGLHCHDMIWNIKKEFDTPMLTLKMKEKIEKHEKKEQMRRLCKHIIEGALPRT